MRWFADPTEAQAEGQREFLRGARGGEHGTALVGIRYRTRDGTYRTTTVVMDIPNPREMRRMMAADPTVPANMEMHVWLENWLQDRLQQFLIDHPEAMQTQSGTPGEQDERLPDVDAEHPVEILGTTWVLGMPGILERLGMERAEVREIARRSVSGVRMFNTHQRSFQYLFPGCDVTNLSHLMENKELDEHLYSCDRMCAYQMLRSRNPGNTDGCQVFAPERVNDWLNQHGHPVGGLHDGLSPLDIQAHAEAFRYPHLAVDLSRSVVSMHLPDHRNRHFKSIAYYVVGDHCQPVVEPKVIESMMKGGKCLLGKRKYCDLLPTHQKKQDNTDGSSVPKKCSRWIKPPPCSLGGTQPTGRGKEEDLSLLGFEEDRKGESIPLEENHLQALDGERGGDEEEGFTLVLEEGEEDVENEGAGGLPREAPNRKRIYPMHAELTQYVHRFQKEDLVLIEEKLDPQYIEGSDPRRVHIFVCTDADNVEFLYQYLVRIRKVDPMQYAMSYAGQCNRIHMRNILWLACRCIDTVLFLHGQLFPKDPWRGQCSLGGYGLIMLQRALQMNPGTSKPLSLVDCMSIYPPDLQRLIDDKHEWNRTKIVQETYQPAYTDPRKESEGKPRCLIPTAMRQRIDLIRSYTSMIRLMAQDQDQFPVFDLTCVVRPFDSSCAIHQSLPIGIYVIRVPKVPQHPALHRLLPFFHQRAGKRLLLTHRLLRFCIVRELLSLGDIEWICISANERQRSTGGLLVQGLNRTVEQVYAMEHHEEAPPTFDPKQLVNHMIGLSQSVKTSTRGRRLVFADLNSLWVLLMGMLSEDQLQATKVLHHRGMFMHKAYDYYEIDSAGSSTRRFHLQPVYQVVVENQAMVIFDMARHIPLSHLVQINCDAIEYKRPDSSTTQWWQDMEKLIISDTDYETAKAKKDVLPLCAGYFHRELVKDESQAMSYHFKYGDFHHTSEEYGSRVHIHYQDTWKKQLDLLHQPEGPMPLMGDWKGKIQRVTDQDTQKFASEWLMQWEKGHGPGLVVTGCAGTGKTHLSRLLCDMALARELRVVKLAFTHAACVQLGPDAMTLHNYFGVDERLGCRSSKKGFGRDHASQDVDILLVDEISMIPMFLWEHLYIYHRCHPQTRIVLVGDFYQLCPVETVWRNDYDAMENYWDRADFMPALLHDFVTDKHGYWLELTECRRSSDPLMHYLCKNPVGIVSAIEETAELHQKLMAPMDPKIPVWRFCARTNRVRKAVNLYCGIRYGLTYPDRVHRWVNVPEEWSILFQKPVSQFHTGKNQPHHWKQLQSFEWVEGMPVICRCTLYFYDKENKETTSQGCVNNRRGLLRCIDLANKLWTVEWENQVDRVILNDKDFIIHFVPGFCSTVHMSQGESVGEHFGVMEWDDIKRDPRMAYVALTRTTHSSLLHLVSNQQAHPWAPSSTISTVADWVTHVLYNLGRWEENFQLGFRSTLKHWEDAIACAVETSTPLGCARCQFRLNLPTATQATFDASLTLLCKPCARRSLRHLPPPPAGLPLEPSPPPSPAEQTDKEQSAEQ